MGTTKMKHWDQYKSDRKARHRNNRQFAMAELTRLGIGYKIIMDDNHVFVDGIKYCLSTGRWSKDSNLLGEGSVEDFNIWLKGMK
jgi:hypothetical protein